MLSVRSFGSQTVAVRLGCLQMDSRCEPSSGRGGLTAWWVGSGLRFVPAQLGKSSPVLMYRGWITWPVCPSHSSHEMSQPLLNQKHAWPLLPVTLRGSSLPAKGLVHQNMKGISVGTVPFQGATSASRALRGGGWVTAPCAEARTARRRSRRSSGWVIYSHCAIGFGEEGVKQESTLTSCSICFLGTAQ